jgi:hypothetical protein
VGTTGVSSRVQAAVAFYPPTDFLAMDGWALRRCEGPRCHDSEGSPESRLVGCADALREAATLRSTATAGCSVTNPAPYTPTWQTVIEFLDKHMKRG